jgi:magnesium chelatase family protein
MSGPLLDRIDLHVEVSPVRWADLAEPGHGEPSRSVATRVADARRRQRRRGPLNATLPDRSLDEHVAASPDARALLGRAVERFGLSARAARRALKVARSIADLAGEDAVGPRAMAEALAYRAETRRS